MDHRFTEPCTKCPFRRTSAPGYLGVDSARNFLAQTTAAHTPMPCHLTIDYNDPDWVDTQLPHAAYCEGALRFLNNISKLPREPGFATAVRASPRDPDTVFTDRAEFLAHHDTAGNHRIATAHGNDTYRYQDMHVD